MLKMFQKFFSQSQHDKEEIAFFVEKTNLLMCYEKQLLFEGHESDEVDEQLMLVKKHLESKAKMLMYEEFGNDKLTFDTYSKENKDNMFFNAIDYCRKHNVEFSLKNLVCKYIKAYGMPNKLSELILKATIANDEEMLNVLEQCLQAIQ